MNSRTIILASQSPRRKELLAKMGVNFTVVPSRFEEHLDHDRPVEEVAIELALGKARDVAKQYPEAIVIGADTIVLIDGKQLGKPKDEAEARETLYHLAGKTNQVCTGLTVICQALEFELVEAVTSGVYFKPANDKDIETYLKSGDWHDKAGSYGLQSGAAPLVDYIEGHYDSILGLPTHILAVVLQQLGVAAKPAELSSPVAVRQA